MDLQEQIAIVEKYITQLNGIEPDEKPYFFAKIDNVTLSALKFVKKESTLQYNRLVELIADSGFSQGMKRAIKKQLNMFLDKLDISEKKENLGEFSEADFDKLDKSSNDEILPTIDNYIKIIEKSRKVKVHWDNMSGYPVFTQIDWKEHKDSTMKIPIISEGKDNKYYQFDDYNETGLKASLNRGMFPAEKNWTGLDKAISFISKNDEIDTYKEWMEGQPSWDKADRFVDDCWTIKLFRINCENDTDTKWAQAFARTFPLSIVHRCLTPGAMTRYTFSIEGQQAIGKTEFCNMLVPQLWYKSVSLIKAKDSPDEFYRETHDKAILELAELGGTDRVTANAFKRLVTERFSSYRPMRANGYVSHPKRNVLIITTNEESDYLRDPTGASRIVPIHSDIPYGQFMDLDWFKEQWPQILAQAVSMYADGARPFFSDDEIALQKEQTNVRDVDFDYAESLHVEDFLKEGNNLSYAKQNGIMIREIISFIEEKKGRLSDAEIGRLRRALPGALIKFGFHKNPKTKWVGKERSTTGAAFVWEWKGE